MEDVLFYSIAKYFVFVTIFAPFVVIYFANEAIVHVYFSELRNLTNS